MRDFFQNKFCHFGFIILLIFLFPAISHAATGTIGTTTNAAWSNNIGWVNFAPINSNNEAYEGVYVTDSTLTGSAWSQNYGWINFAPLNGGVINDGHGHLSGTAWGSNIGWIGFSGVSINTTTGKFSGTATGTIIGILTFNCTHCDVETDWRPGTTTPPHPPTGGGGGVLILDTTPPVITINGNITILLTVGDTYIDAGATATDNEDGNVTSRINITGLPINTSATGTFSIVYKVSDNAGNMAVATRTVEIIAAPIIDNIPPVITVTGGTPTTVFLNSNYVDKGATAMDNTDGKVPVVIIFNNVDTNILGTYFVEYEATDTAGNIANATRKVYVVEESTSTDNIPPVITVTGGTPITITVGSTYTDEGATAFDNVSGSVPAYVISNNVDTSKPGTYEITYTATDEAGNVSTVTRTVNVVSSPINNPKNPNNQNPLIPPALTNELNSIVNNFSGVVGDLINGLTNGVKDIISNPFSVAKDIAEGTKQFVNTDTGSAVTKTISTLGVATGLSLPVAAASVSISDFWLSFLRLLGFFLELSGLKRKNRPWGTVYDSITKRPLDPAVVSLINTETNVEVDSAITDIDGRYGFLVLPGKYRIETKKTNYTSPSLKMMGKLFDEVYNDLYFGGELVIINENETITKNIPMDPLSFNWNEFAKTKMDVNKFMKGSDVTWARISKILFSIGAIVSLIALIYAPVPYNYIIFGLYVVAYVLNYVVFKTKKSGRIAEKNTNIPLSFAIVNIFREGEDAPFAKKIADKFGGYYALLPNGKYYIKVEKKNDDETYTEVLKTSVLDVAKGILNLDFKI